MALTGKQRRFLRGLGHHLQPLVMVGKEGLTEALVGAVEQALLDHELVKIRIGQNAMLERQEVAQELSQRTSSDVAQVLGSTMLLYRKHPDEPEIKLP